MSRRRRDEEKEKVKLSYDSIKCPWKKTISAALLSGKLNGSPARIYDGSLGPQHDNELI